MFGFPINSQSNDIQKFTNNADSGFPKIQQREIFYSITNGVWDDRTVWQTASGRVGLLPTQNDDVYIRNTIQITGSATPFNCNNLFISGILNMQNRDLNVYGNFKNIGIVNSGVTVGFISRIILYGVENILGVINQNNNTDIRYARDGVQYIQPFNYYRLSTAGTGVKYLTSNTVVLENLVLNSITSPNYINGVVSLSDDRLPIFECAGYELEVYGQTLINQWAIFKQSGSGRLKFRGFVGVGFSVQYPGGFLLPGNPNVELQNGFYMSYDINLGYGARGGLYSGTGTWTFTTNNQNIGTNVLSVPNFILDCPILIDAGITLTVSSPFSALNSSLYLNNTINGVSSTSKLVNKSSLYFNTLASVASMTTGIFDRTTFANTVGYTGNYSATIPFGTFHDLTIGGTGTKTQASGTNTINGNLTINAGARLDSGGNTTVSGLTSIGNLAFLNLLSHNWTFAALTQTVGRLSKTGVGNIIINGLWTATDAAASFLDFSGNPTVELRGGILFKGFGSSANFNTGTGLWSFTTNSQTIEMGYITQVFACPILIIGNITVTLGGPLNGAMQLNNYLDGTTAGSTFTINKLLYLNYAVQPLPMFTAGVFNPLGASTSVIGHIFDGDYTLPYTTYNGLAIGGTGTKTLLGDTSVTSFSSFSVSGIINSIFELSTFNFTNSGVTNITSYRLLIRKSGGGNILFSGLVNMTAASNFGGFDFSGNPNVEFRNGFTNGGGQIVTFNTGTGTWSFTTNNQSFILLFDNKTINAQFLISGAITLVTNFSNGVVLNGLINGDNASSRLQMAANSFMNYRSVTQPMATGILDTSTNLNTWIYGLNNQSIKGSPTISPKQVYRNLTLNGTGVKTLQGYCSVLNTYTLTSPATLNLNGFTLTNP